ncbi:uncharacterized protein LOC143354873 [Halictus rubicundus]|uniref:uncharacterized protein LOC143354873 n=1 Tax=Halictus rubicundus TaxID=77578 RepID=UPI004035FC4C
MLVYKFLSLGRNPAESWTLPDRNPNGCSSHWPKGRKVVQRRLSSRVSEAKNMINKQKKSRKFSKMHLAKRGRASKEQVMDDCVCKHGGEGIRKMKKYIQKALDFGVESGYLIPKDAAYRVLRVSSDLVSDGNYLKDSRSSGRVVSQDRNRSPDRTPNKLKDCEVHDTRARRSNRKRRSRSGSSPRRQRSRKRKRGRKRGRSANKEEEEQVLEGDDYEFDNQPEKKGSAENASKEKRNDDRSNESDGEKTTMKREEEGSDLSVDEEDTDEDEKKGDDGNKS